MGRDSSGRRSAAPLTWEDIVRLARDGAPKSEGAWRPVEVAEGHRPGLRLRVTKQYRAVWRWGGIMHHGAVAPSKQICTAYKRGWLKSQVEAAQQEAWATADKWHHAFVAEGSSPAQLVAAEAHQAAIARDLAVPTLRAYIKDTYKPHVEAHNKDFKASLARIDTRFVNWEVPAAERGPRPVMLGDWPIDQINQAVIAAWQQAGIRAGKATATLKRDLTALRSALSPRNVPALQKWLTTTPFTVSGLKVKQENPRYLKRGSKGEDDEYERLMSSLDAREARQRAERTRYNLHRTERHKEPYPDFDAVTFTDHLKPMTLVLLHTGMRPGELRALKWGDVDLPNRKLHVRAATTKTGAARTIPMNDVAFGVLKQWRAQTKGIGYVLAKQDGSPVGSVRKAFDSVLRAAKIKDFRLYDLRHTFASWLVQAGVSLYQIKDLMGHSTVTMTERYAHLRADHGRDVVALLA